MLENLWDEKEKLRDAYRENRSDEVCQVLFGKAINAWETALENTLKENNVSWKKPHSFFDLDSGLELEGDKLITKLSAVLGSSLVEKMSFDFRF